MRPTPEGDTLLYLLRSAVARDQELARFPNGHKAYWISRREWAMDQYVGALDKENVG